MISAHGLIAAGDSLERILADSRALVECESPSAVPEAVLAAAEVARDILAASGMNAELIEIDGCTHLRFVNGSAGHRVLLLGHLDTVWPIGSLITHPFSADDGVLRGPGTFDMKVGAAIAFELLRILGPDASVTLLLTGDEEVGATSSRRLIEATAETCDAVFVLEASAPGGAVKTRRKGVAEYRITANGRAAHAGLEPERGINATLELAHAAIEITGFADAALGTTVSPTRMESGTTLNTIPATGTLSVDSRAWSVEEQLRVDARLRSLGTRVPGSRLEIGGGPSRPPLEASASTALFGMASAAARRLGLPTLAEAHVGGGSDGNFTAALGVPTIDGLGAVGGGAHADDEHVSIEAISPRLALLEVLTRDVLANGVTDHRRALPTPGGTLV